MEPKRDRRTERRKATKDEILDAAWTIVRSDGLSALSLRELAHKVAMKAPSLYGYFDSKHAIYDAMYAAGAREFVAGQSALVLPGDPLGDLRAIAHYFIGFCTADVARYQLLFQRTIPGFEPSSQTFEISVASLQAVRQLLGRCGVTDPGALDLFTAIGTGLADQQISNDPGGDRWVRLVDEAMEMFLNHVRARSGPTKGAH